MPVQRIVSGGQTGVDRAALDAALAAGLAIGGWCPRGRRAEDGAIDPRYPLVETAAAAYGQRTRRNVRDSDATLILCAGPPTGGTALTLAIARKMGRPARVLSPADGGALDEAARWLTRTEPETLNVAGPRESTAPGIYRQAREWLLALFRHPVFRSGPASPSP